MGAVGREPGQGEGSGGGDAAWKWELNHEGVREGAGWEQGIGTARSSVPPGMHAAHVPLLHQSPPALEELPSAGGLQRSLRHLLPLQHCVAGTHSPSEVL